MAYTPASQVSTSGTLAHLQQIYAQKTALDQLRTIFRFQDLCEEFTIPKNSGRTIQMYRYDNLTAVSTPTAEGTVGTGGTFSSKILTMTLSQLTNFISLSDVLVDTAPDDMVAAAARLLGYRAGLSVDTMTRATIDAENANVSQSPGATNLKVGDLRTCRHLLQAANVHPFMGGMFRVITSPFSSYDLVNDSAAGGLADIFKYTGPKDTALVKYEDRGTVAEVAGCQVIESTNVYNSGTTYRTYIHGKGGLGTVSLAGRGPSKVTDPDKQNFRVNVNRAPEEGSIYDPERVIAATVAYNFLHTVGWLDGPAGIGGTFRAKQVDAVSTIA